jgi:general secretion pathway protein E
MEAPTSVVPTPDATAVRVSAQDLQDASRRAVASGRTLITELQEATGGEPRALLREIASAFDVPVMETAQMLQAGPAFDLLPLSRAMQRGCLLLRDGDDPTTLLAVFTDPFDETQQIWLETMAGERPVWHLALPADIQAYLSRQEESARALDSEPSAPAGAAIEGRAATVLSFASISDAASPAVRLLNSTLYDALKVGASDIHLECTPAGLAIKYRVDGVLDQAGSASGAEAAEQVISRLKVLAELDIAERRIPQDGSFRVEAAGRDIDLRVSIMPSIHGEDAVIRVLDKRSVIQAHGALTLEALGFDPHSLAALRQLAQEAYGMLLVTGPTGSGKTTTLYATLSEINNGRDKIVTIEDPVEYQLAGVLQIPVNEKKGLSFAKGLRSILRHDPDKIMVGEIRDRETAEIAVQSALTGHLVLTTVHANNVFDVFGRFSHMGIDPYAFVSALNGVWAQRLVRTVCPHCAASHRPEAAELARLNLTPDQVEGWTLRQGAGCGDCRGTGYKGRRSIAEILILNDLLREMIVDRRPIRQIKEAAREAGTRSLREAALALVKRGETTLAETRRVTQHA